jgi:hypothetical protein
LIISHQEMKMSDFEVKVKSDIDEINRKLNILIQAIEWMTQYNMLNDPNYLYTIDTLRVKLSEDINKLRNNCNKSTGDTDE